MNLTEKDLKGLTKPQLLHILIEVIGIIKVSEMWQESREFQTHQKGIPCWECQEIHNRLAKAEGREEK